MDTMQQLADALAEIHKGTKADVIYTTYDNGSLEFVIGWYDDHVLKEPLIYRHSFAISEIMRTAPGLLTELLIKKAKEKKDGKIGRASGRERV